MKTYAGDYGNQFEWMAYVKEGIGPLIISAIIMGAGQSKNSNPHLPIPLEEQVAEPRRRYEARVSIIHRHAFAVCGIGLGKLQVPLSKVVTSVLPAG